MEIIIRNKDELEIFSKRISNLIYPGCVITLSGDLGAGKTTLSKMIAKNIGVVEDVTSPTYNILKIYESGKLPLYHYDLYRLDGCNFDYDLEEYMYLEGLSLIEWPDKFREILPDKRLDIKISIIDDHKRELKIIDKTGSFGEINGLNN